MQRVALTGLENSSIIVVALFPKTLSQKAKFGKLLVIVVCLALAMFMTAEAAHSHAAGPADSAHCQLCASAHVAVDTQPAWLTSYVLRLIDLVPVAEASPGSSPVVVTAYIRPPPALSI